MCQSLCCLPVSEEFVYLHDTQYRSDKYTVLWFILVILMHVFGSVCKLKERLNTNNICFLLHNAEWITIPPWDACVWNKQRLAIHSLMMSGKLAMFLLNRKRAMVQYKEVKGKEKELFYVVAIENRWQIYFVMSICLHTIAVAHSLTELDFTFELGHVVCVHKAAVHNPCLKRAMLLWLLSLKLTHSCSLVSSSWKTHHVKCLTNVKC